MLDDYERSSPRIGRAMVLQALERMGELYIKTSRYEANPKQKERLYHSVEYCLRMVEGSLPPDIQKALKFDRVMLENALESINSTDEHEDTKDMKRGALLYSYAVSRMYYVHQATNNKCKFRLSKNAEIDFERIELDKVTAIVRTGTNTASFLHCIKLVLEPKEQASNP